MEAYAETASKAVAEAENALRIALDQRLTDYAGFEPLLERLRRASQDFIFLTFFTPVAKSAATRLWDDHLRVNKKFQKHLKQFREGLGRKKHVERRKAEKHYLAFIKASMQFYRGFIQRLGSTFQNVPEIQSIASKLHLDTLSVEAVVDVNTEQKAALLQTCHDTLMRLGDLSRYRETELQQKERNWGPAKGHYQLAISLLPEHGAAYNQLAVMALADEDHFRAVYYLHRASAAGKPFKLSPDNLKLQFEKILKFPPSEKSAVADMSSDAVQVLEDRLMAFHANCHTKPGEFLSFVEKSTQILQLVTVGFEEIKDRSLDKLLQKMCVINIAAEHLALTGASGIDPAVASAKNWSPEKLKDEDQRSGQAFFLLQRFNIQTFLALLKIFARELDADSADVGSETDDKPARIPGSVKRTLPHLRQYSHWLLSNIKALLKPKHTSTQTRMDELWKVYTQALNMILTRYTVQTFPEVDHLLDEDEDTLSFAPFSSNVRAWHHQTPEGDNKPAFASNSPTERPLNIEMCYRLRELVVDALRISKALTELDIEWSPIALVGPQFVLAEKPKEKPVPVSTTPSQPFRRRGHLHGISGDAKVANVTTKLEAETTKQAALDHTHSVANGSAHDTENMAFRDMVDNLVDQPVNEAPAPDPPPNLNTQQKPTPFNTSSLSFGTPNPQPGLVTAMDLVRKMQRSSVSPAQTPVLGSANLNNPSLPSIWNTPFTPRPGEYASTSPRPLTANAVTSREPGSSAAFQQILLEQERETYLRTSSPPQQFVPSSLTYSRSPRVDASPWSHNQIDMSSPWHSPLATSPRQSSRQLAPAPLFGAVGDPRRANSRTPTNGQSG